VIDGLADGKREGDGEGLGDEAGAGVGDGSGVEDGIGAAHPETRTHRRAAANVFIGDQTVHASHWFRKDCRSVRARVI